MAYPVQWRAPAAQAYLNPRQHAAHAHPHGLGHAMPGQTMPGSAQRPASRPVPQPAPQHAPHPVAVAHQPQHAPQLVPQPAPQLAPSSGGLAPRTLPSLDSAGAPRPPAGMNAAVRVPMLQQPGMTQQMLASQAQVSRPVAVQMARLPSQVQLDTQLSRTASRPRILQDFSQLSLEQLVQLCRSLQNQCETNKQLLAERVKEQGKLLTEREVLRRRKEDLERTLDSSRGQDGLPSAALPPATESVAGGEVVSPVTPEVTISATVAPSTQPSMEETLETVAPGGVAEQSQQDELVSPVMDAKQTLVASEDGHQQLEQISLASPAPLSGNPEAVPSPDVTAVSKPATATATSQLISEEISLASPIRPAETQNFAVPLASPKVFHPHEVVTLASPVQAACPANTSAEACAANMSALGTPEAKCLEGQSVQPDLASGRPVASPMSPGVKVKEATSPETLSATTVVADTPPEDGKVNGVPCSGDAAAGVGAKSEQDQIKVLSPSYGSLDGSSVLPDCETMGQDKSVEAKQILSAPEELMARVEDASIRLTWFFDEEMLEQFAAGPAELTFQIRQQSEGVGGRLRIREHSSPAFYSAKDGAVQAQSFLIEGCAPGRPYTFSIRCRLQLPGTEARVSDFCESVTACVPAATSTTKAPPSLCSTAASVDAKGMLEEASVASRRLPVAAAILAAQAASGIDRSIPTVQPLPVEQPEQTASPPGQPVRHTQLAPVEQPAVQPAELPAVPVQPAFVQPGMPPQLAPAEQSVLPAQPAPVEQPAPAAQPAPVEQPAPAAQLAGTERPTLAPPLSIDEKPVQGAQGAPDVQPIQASEFLAEGRRIVPKVSEAEAARPVDVTSAPEACSRFLPDEGGALRKWLQDYKGSEASRVTPARPMEITNGRVPQVEVGQGSEDQSFLRQWLQNRQAPSVASSGPSLRGQAVARISTVEMDATRLTDQDVRLQVGDWSRYEESGPASSRLQSVAAQDMRQLEMQPPSSFQIPDFRHSSFAPFSTHGDLRPPGAILGNARSKSFGGVERRATMMPKLESRHADLSPGRGAGDSIRIVTAMTPNGHGLVAPLPAHLSGGFGGTPVSRQAPDPVTMGNALTTINSLPQPHASWTQGQQVQTDAFQTHGLNQQQALFGQPAIVASNFFTPINDNLFGAGSSALGSTRPFSHFPSGPVSGAESLFKPTAAGMAMSAFPEEESRQFDPPPPPRSAPSLQYQEDPPRRDPVMPAWDEPRQGFGVTQNVNPVSSIRNQGRKSELKVRMSDNHWESLRFSSGDDLDWAGQQFVSRCGLKSAFLPGVVERLKQMIAIQQDYACVDVVDLI